MQDDVLSEISDDMTYYEIAGKSTLRIVLKIDDDIFGEIMGRQRKSWMIDLLKLNSKTPSRTLPGCRST